MTDLRSTVSKIGSGPRSAEDMGYDEAREAFSTVLDGDTDPTTLGAFWLANRWKSNTPDELAGFVDTMRERVETAEPSVDPVDCGANYDGKRETALLGVAAGVVASAAGTPVVVHSSDGVPTKNGVTYRHVLEELGVETELTPDESAEMVDETGFGFYYAPNFNPAVHGLLDRREAMGVRTFVNTVETLANPAAAEVHIGSFYHLTFAKRIIDTVSESGVGFERVVMFQGLEGYDDVRPGYTKVADWDGVLEDYEIETGDYGAEFERDALEVEDVAADSARITEEVVSGDARDRSDGFTDAVALNAGLRIYARGDSESIEDGVEEARGVIESGDAADVLTEVREFG